MRFRPEFARPRNYFDLLRGAAGGLAIVGGFGLQPAIAVATEGSRLPEWQVLALKLAIVMVGVFIQTLRYERGRIGFFAPIFYLAGLTVSLCSGWGALFAFILIWAISPMLPNAPAFLAVYGIAAAVFGLLFQAVGRVLPIAAFLCCFLPVLLSLLARRPLVVFTRKPVRAAGSRA